RYRSCRSLLLGFERGSHGQRRRRVVLLLQPCRGALAVVAGLQVELGAIRAVGISGAMVFALLSCLRARLHVRVLCREAVQTQNMEPHIHMLDNGSEPLVYVLRCFQKTVGRPNSVA